MRTSRLSVLAAVLGFVFVFAADRAAPQSYVPVNNSSSGICNTLPMSTSQIRFQILVDARYLPSQPSRITDVALAPCAPPLLSFQQLEVRLAHTSLSNFRNNNTNFNRNLGPCPIVLHSGPLTWTAVANTWSPLNVTGSFAHDGRRNVIVEIRYYGASASGVGCYRDTVVPRLYAFGPGQYVATTGVTDSGTTEAGPRLRLSTSPMFVLLGPDSLRLGQRGALTATGLPGGQTAQFAASLAQAPVLNFGRCKLRLAVDGLFRFSVAGGAPIFAGYAASITATGQLTATMTPPNFPALVGLCVYNAALAYSTSGITGCTNTTATLLTP